MTASDCEKCGSESVSTAFHKQQCHRPGCNCAPCSFDAHEKRHTEHLHYTCRMCGFDWTGDVLTPAAALSTEDNGQ